MNKTYLDGVQVSTKVEMIADLFEKLLGKFPSPKYAMEIDGSSGSNLYVFGILCDREELKIITDFFSVTGRATLGIIYDFVLTEEMLNEGNLKAALGKILAIA